MLGFGVPGIWLVLGAISVEHHGRAIFQANHASRGPLGREREVYVGIVEFREKKSYYAQLGLFVRLNFLFFQGGGGYWFPLT